MLIAGVYICSSSCTCLFTVNEHVICVVASHVDVFACHAQLCSCVCLQPNSLPYSIHTHHQRQHTTTQMNKHKAGGVNDAGHCLGPSVSFILLLVELFLLLTKCFSFRFLYLDYDITHPLNNTQALRRHCEPLLAGWQWALFCPATTTTRRENDKR